MTGNPHAGLFACLAFLAGGLPQGNLLSTSIGGSALPDGVRNGVVIEQQTDQPDISTITLDGRKGRKLAAALRAGDDVKVESGTSALFTGEVVSIEPIVDRLGSSVEIRALNRLHRLASEPKSRDFLDRTDAEIVEIIARENGLVPAPAPELQQRYERVTQHDQTDLEFVRERATRIGYEVFVEDTTLLFRRREDSPPIVLARRGAAGDLRLRRLHPRLSSTATVQRVVVRGFDPDRREIVGEAVLPTVLLVPGEPDDPGLVFGRTIELQVDQPISSVKEAEAVAKAKLEELSLSYISGEAEATGSPSLRAGRLVVIADLGDRFDGEYYVAEALHRFSPGRACGGYKTELRLRRKDQGLFHLPEIDDEVLVAFENGDLREPFVVGSLWDDGSCSRDRSPED